MLTWDSIVSFLVIQPAGATFAFAKDGLPHPLDVGAVTSVGWPVGQRGDYRFPPTATCSGVHVQDFGGEWRVHRDAVHPDCGVVEHVRQDAAPAWLLGGACACAALAAIAARKPGAAVVGALIGALVAAALLSEKET